MNNLFKNVLFIILGLLVFVGLYIFVFQYIPYLKFKSNCIEQISKRDFGNYITIYFKPNLSEEKQVAVEELKNWLSKIDGVQSIKYISVVDVVKEFLEKHKIERDRMKSIGVEVYDFGEEVTPERLKIFESRIEIIPKDDKTEDYFRNAINIEIKNLELEESLQSFKISIINKENYIKTIVRFSSFMKLKLSPRAQDLKSFYKLSDCEALQIAPLYGVNL